MRKPHLLQHLIEEGHGDPETAGAAVKIVQVLTGPEVEPSSTDDIEWGSLDIQDTENLLLTNQDQNIQTIMYIPDENGQPIEIQVIGHDHDHQSGDHHHLPFDLNHLNGETFQISGTSMSELLKHTNLQESHTVEQTIEETIDSLL